VRVQQRLALGADLASAPGGAGRPVRSAGTAYAIFVSVGVGPGPRLRRPGGSRQTRLSSPKRSPGRGAAHDESDRERYSGAGSGGPLAQPVASRAQAVG
jgi:hypothetical protein